MEVLALLIPLSIGFAVFWVFVFAWNNSRGQFDDSDRAAMLPFEDE